jgi:hypothetical protein
MKYLDKKCDNWLVIQTLIFRIKTVSVCMTIIDSWLQMFYLQNFSFKVFSGARLLQGSTHSPFGVQQKVVPAHVFCTVGASE